jgi:HEAT repeat protein
MIFLSYARPDLEVVRKLYENLKLREIEVWFDQVDLGPGKWKPQILRAIRRSRYFLICLSQSALAKTGDKPGFQDTELNEAYNIAIDQDEEHFTIIPVRLEDCDRGDNRLSQFQQFDLFANWDDTLDRLAVWLGGRSLGSTIVDERTDKEKQAHALQGRIITFHYAGEEKKAEPDVEALVQLLSNEDEDSNARYTAASALRLAQSPTTSVVETLIKALKDKEVRIRRIAAESLLSLDLAGNDAILTLLLGALQDKTPFVRFNGAAAIGRLGPKAELAVDSLNRALADEDWRVRRIACETLGSIGPAAESAIGPLLKVLEDQGNNDWVRSNAALALARIGPKTEPVVVALSSALNDGSEKVRNAAGQALEAIRIRK